MSREAMPDVPPHFQTFLAFDFGARRTGVAVGSRLLRSATPQPTIRAEGDAPCMQCGLGVIVRLDVHQTEDARTEDKTRQDTM